MMQNIIMMMYCSKTSEHFHLVARNETHTPDRNDNSLTAYGKAAANDPINLPVPVTQSMSEVRIEMIAIKINLTCNEKSGIGRGFITVASSSRVDTSATAIDHGATVFATCSAAVDILLKLKYLL